MTQAQIAQQNQDAALSSDEDLRHAVSVLGSDVKQRELQDGLFIMGGVQPKTTQAEIIKLQQVFEGE